MIRTISAKIIVVVDVGMYEKTVILFVSDNGGNPIIGAGGNNYPLRQGERFKDLDILVFLVVVHEKERNGLFYVLKIER